MSKSPTLRVLVVDDEALLRWSLAETLRSHGHTVTEATSASDARGVVASGQLFDVVFLDYRLPDSNDLRLLEDLMRQMPRAAVLLMTAHGTTDVVEGAMDRGVYRVLTKPFDMHDVNGLAQGAFRTTGRH